MPKRFTAPLPVPAGVQTRHPRTRRWWATLAPRPTGRGRTLHADWMTFTVQTPDEAASETWTAQQLKGEVAVELAPGRFSVWMLVDDVESHRPKKGMRRWLERGHPRTPVGVTVPTSAITGIEVVVEYPTTSSDLAEQAHIAAHRHGWPMSARMRVEFTVESHECDAIVDLHHPRSEDEAMIWEMVQHIADERYRSGAVTEPKLQDGQVVRVRVREAPTLDVVEHAAEAPSHFRRTLDLHLPAAEAVTLGEPKRGSLETDGLGDKLFGD